jgi:hypothetical protein
MTVATTSREAPRPRPRRARDPRFVATLVATIVGLTIALYSIAPCFEAGFGPTDDHEIALFLGPEHALPLGGVLPRILATEAAAPGASTRYRPAYYVLRTLEAFAWGPHPELWYLARALYFAAGLATLLVLLRRAANALECAAVLAAVASSPIWGDTFARLGPAETFTVVGAALFALGAARAFDALAEPASPPRAFLAAAALVGVGGVIAVGAKENLLVLCAPAAYLAWRGLRAGRRGRALVVAGGLVTLFGLFVAGAVVVGMRRHGHVYAAEVTAGGRLGLLVKAARALAPLVVVPLVVAAGALALLRRRAGAGDARRELVGAVRSWAIAIGLLAALYASQQVFYGADWPRGARSDARYDFPGVLVWPLGAFATYRLALAILTALGLGAKAMERARLVAPLVAIALLRPSLPARRDAERMAPRTRGYSEAMEGLATMSTTKAGWPIVIVCHGHEGYEDVVAIRRFLHYHGATAPMFLRWEGPASAEPGLARILGATLSRVADEGGGADTLGDVPFEPWSRFQGAPCIGVGVGGPAAYGCVPVLELR